MSQTSHLSRYRPAVFAITGAAAAYGIYVLYTTFSRQPSKWGLHRSNAVCSRRHRPPPFAITHKPPNEDAPLGKVIVSEGEIRLETDVNSHGAPSVRQVKDLFPGAPERLYTQSLLDTVAVQCVMNACMLAEGNEQIQAELGECGVGGISEAMQARDIARVLSLATPLLHQIVDTDHGTIQNATLEFLAWTGMADAGDAVRNAREPQQRLPADTNTGNSDHAETEQLSDLADTQRESEQGLKGLLYHIAETDAKRKAYEHRGIRCEECGESPIRGLRWHCQNCPDFDLCSTCEANTAHQKNHVFVKIKIPLPVLSQPTRVYPLWYPGEPRKIFSGLSPDARTHLRKTYDLDDAHMDAYYDQFTSFANVRWTEDPVYVRAAIDRRAFNKALTCERWPNRFRPNALYDRMFALYDTDGNSLIGFSEFLDGIAYLRGPKRFNSLQRALQGFDIDADGYLARQDFLRLLQAKFEIQTILVNDMVEAQEREQTHDALDTLRSSQPISSIFSWEEIPQGEERMPGGKARDVNGDLQPLEGTKTILDENDKWRVEQAQRQHRLPFESHEQLRYHISRFEEVLSSPTGGASSQGEGTSINGAGANGVVVTESGNDAPLDEDIIWQITQDGFNEILDRMFQAKEEEDRQIVEARPEIERWRNEIDEFMKQKEELKKVLQDEIRSSETVGPLLETAMNSLNESVQVKPKKEESATDAPAFKSDIVATDHESLTKREKEIAHKPLDELLKDTGYSAIDLEGGQGTTTDAQGRQVNEDDTASDSSVGSPDSELDRILGLDGTAQPPFTSTAPALDPTMPQNRPNSSVPTSTSNGNGDDVHIKFGQPASAKHKEVSGSSRGMEIPPPKDRLEYLGNLVALDREIEARGGPGRLSYDEIEAMVKNDTTKELKGLVVDWLEWASF